MESSIKLMEIMYLLMETQTKFLEIRTESFMILTLLKENRILPQEIIILLLVMVTMLVATVILFQEDKIPYLEAETRCWVTKMLYLAAITN